MTQQPTQFRTVAVSADIAEGDVVPFYLADHRRRVSLARIAGRLYAFDDLCTREAVPLSAGLLTGTTLLCQCHGCQYDVATGAVLRGPATEALGVHEVREADGEVQLGVTATSRD